MTYFCYLTNNIISNFEKNTLLFLFVIVLCIILQVLIAVIPAGPFQFMAGIIYGPFIGSIICLIAFIIGSILVYCITKKYGYNIISKFVKKDDIDKFKFLINSNKYKLIFIILFIIPGSPKDVMSYIAGLTDISLWQFILINLIGRIPSTFLTAYSGDLFSDSKIEQSIKFIIILIIISILGYFIYDYIKSKYNKNKPL